MSGIPPLLLSGLAQPAGGFLAVFCNAVAQGVHQAEVKLRKDIALLSKWPPVPQRRCVVPFIKRHLASVVVRLKALRYDGLRQRQCEDQ